MVMMPSFLVFGLLYTPANEGEVSARRASGVYA
jgi:hypothetical protein